MSIEEAVGGVPGVERADVDIDASTVALEYDGSNETFTAIVAAIEDVGYEVPAQ
jgi:copper chaperone CopZ